MLDVGLLCCGAVGSWAVGCWVLSSQFSVSFRSPQSSVLSILGPPDKSDLTMSVLFHTSDSSDHANASTSASLGTCGLFCRLET